MNLVWKLLKQNISKGQFAGFFVANLLGLTIVLAGIQFYSDINPLLNEKDTVLKRDFLVLTKKVKLLNAVDPGATGFSKNELRSIDEARFATAVGAFTPSRFRVFGGINMNQQGFSTEMFFESVPDSFIDVKTSGWGFSPDKDVIPIILPKNYLDLYNFGFAEARSMPKISQSVVGMVDLNIMISGKGMHRNFRGHIQGFSSRINTILVPETFMTWANENYGEGVYTPPSRLMVEVNNPADPEIATFLAKKGYEVEGEKSAVSKMSFFLKILVTVVVVIGVIICALSFFVLTLSIYLLLEKNMEKMRNLRLIGYSKSTVVAPYQRLAVAMNVTILVLSVALVALLRMRYCEAVRSVWTNFEGVGMLPSILTGLGIFALLSALNVFIIARKVK